MRRLGRRIEERSDRLGRGHEGLAEGAAARGLVKLYAANLMPAVLPDRRQVHPHLGIGRHDPAGDGVKVEQAIARTRPERSCIRKLRMHALPGPEPVVPG